jgi:hypothetical protein
VGGKGYNQMTKSWKRWAVITARGALASNILTIDRYDATQLARGRSGPHTVKRVIISLAPARKKVKKYCR